MTHWLRKERRKRRWALIYATLTAEGQIIKKKREINGQRVNKNINLLSVLPRLRLSYSDPLVFGKLEVEEPEEAPGRTLVERPNELVPVYTLGDDIEGFVTRFVSFIVCVEELLLLLVFFRMGMGLYSRLSEAKHDGATSLLLFKLLLLLLLF